ncbi:hypothetical protein EVAR_80063_1 [Eumeta japonica]|uniref:Uncharacterized protein n=1 Tax=Eumeta variegata TaxID=151549 RepID=A0A4C1UDK8_EUMVA|nr:hypothetical protein EVAR_80063_1 [Eumeta japonica]
MSPYSYITYQQRKLRASHWHRLTRRAARAAATPELPFGSIHAHSQPYHPIALYVRFANVLPTYFAALTQFEAALPIATDKRELTACRKWSRKRSNVCEESFGKSIPVKDYADQIGEILKKGQLLNTCNGRLA